MKRNLLTATVLLGATLVSSACDNGLADINDNPNAPTDVPAQYLLPEAIVSMVEFGDNNTWYTLEYAGLFTQHWAKIQYTDEDQYSLRDNVINNFWDGMYAGPMKDFQLIIEKGMETAAEGDEGLGHNRQAIGMIGKAYLASIMTDMWGDIPYTDALSAGSEDGTTAPAYDEQSALYETLLSDLETAVGLLDPDEASFDDADLLYGGDVEGWIRFANSLRLRMLMRMSDVADVQARVVALAGQPLITSNDWNAGLAYPGAVPWQNPYFENAAGALGGGGTRDDHAVSNTLVGIMGALNDPRIEVYANPAQEDSLAFVESWCDEAGELPCHIVYNGEVYRGMRNGINSGDVPKLAIISRIGRYFRANPATPQYIMTAAEVHFLLAEAALNGWAVGGTPAGHYEAGVRAAFDLYDGVVVAATGAPVDLGTAVQTAYLAQPGVAYGTGDSPLEQIIEQKWLALYTMPSEAYAEYRRTGYPDEIQPAADSPLLYVPGRIPYPSLESSLNPTNLEAAIGRQTTDGTYCGKLWWDPEAPAGMTGC